MEKIVKIALDVFGGLFGYAKSNFQKFIAVLHIFFIICLVVGIVYLWKANNLEVEKNSIGCDKRLEKQELIFLVQSKMLQSENDSLKAQVFRQQIQYASTIERMKNEQMAIYQKILNIK
jgi:phage-related holin